MPLANTARDRRMTDFAAFLKKMIESNHQTYYKCSIHLQNIGFCLSYNRDNKNLKFIIASLFFISI